MTKFLSGAAIRTAIGTLMQQPGERIIAVAFIGPNPRAWMPEPAGIDIYCWPKPGATVPAGIDALVHAGARVHFVNKLHGKIYWHRDAGAVLGSANLSHSALQDGGLTEAAVLLPPGDAQLADFLAQLRGQAELHGSPDYHRRLAWLRSEHVNFLSHNPDRASELAAPDQTPSFGDWLALDPATRPLWQLGWWQIDPPPPADTAAQQADASDGHSCANYRAGPTSDYMLAHVATLDCRLNRDFRLCQKKGDEPYWWYPQEPRHSSLPEWQALPYQWYAQKLIPDGATVPFDATEPKFVSSLQKALDAYEGDLSAVCGAVPQELLDLLRHYYLEEETAI